MKIVFEQVRPQFFEPQGVSQFWGEGLSLEPGERVLLVGPSGRGKSSVISFLYGLNSGYEGRIQCGGRFLRDLTPEDWAQWRQSHVALVFQTLRLFSELSGWDNLRLYARMGGKIITANDEDQWLSWAARLGIQAQLNRPVAAWSQGERQRLSLIRALTREFSWILLDEPFSHLDGANALLLWDLLVEETQRRKAGLFLTSLEPLHHDFDRRIYL